MNNDEQLEFLINYLLDERSESIDIPKTFSEKRNLLRSLMNMRRPSNISEEFLRIQDEFLSRETANKNLTSVEDISLSSGKIMLWQGDITTLSADAIVNAANSTLRFFESIPTLPFLWSFFIDSLKDFTGLGKLFTQHSHVAGPLAHGLC